MRKIYLEPPEIQGRTATFRWRMTPAASLYRQDFFTMTFPDSLDLSRVPPRLWWDVMMICLHAQWPLLRPCEIHLPVRLGPGERQFWRQLLRNSVDTQDAHSREGQAWPELGIDIVDGDLDCPRTVAVGEGYGSAFSGGKDSLLQAGLLAELTQRPLLVATTSPLPPLRDHDTARREQVFAAIQARRDVRFVEVRSDFRGIWNNSFPLSVGYTIGVNELGDTFLYMASLLIAGAASGATRLFVASEAELQDTSVVDGRIVQHSHFMYSAATQRALAALLAPYGIQFGSLTWPLFSDQVQRLLWERYPDLSDLQYSCWQVAPGEAMCSQCSECLRIGMVALAARRDPRTMGMNLVTLLDYAPSWERPIVPAADGELPKVTGARRSHAITRNAIRQASPFHVARLLCQGDPLRLLSAPVRRSLNQFRRLRRQTPRMPTPAAGMRQAFCDWLDPGLHDRLVDIYTRHLGREPRALHFAAFDRSRALTDRVTSSLDIRYADPDAA
jgi:hypothetical protein